MANIKYNLDDNIFLKNRLSFHAASKVGISTKESLAQATNVDGHTVTDTQVWIALNSEFPKNTGDNKTTSDGVAATNDLVEVFTNKRTVSEKITKTSLPNGGFVWRNADYPAVELYDQAVMSAVANSDDEAWELKVDGSRVMDWVAATSVKDNGLPVPGYAGIIEADNEDNEWVILQKSPNASKNNTSLTYGWELAKATWEFIYMPGMLKFHPDYIPSLMSYKRIRITAFKYIGKYLNDIINTVKSELLNVKPYLFDFSSMTNYVVATGNFLENVEYYTYSKEKGYSLTEVTIGEEIPTGEDAIIYYNKNQNEIVGEADYVIQIPGFVTSIINNNYGVTFSEIEYNNNGSLIKFSNTNKTFFNNSTFTAYVLIVKNTNSIKLLEQTNLIKQGE